MKPRMGRESFVILIFILSLSLRGFATIYGTDDRLEYYQLSEKQKLIARSVPALMDVNDLQKLDGDNWLIAAKPFGESYCSSEKFSGQPTGAECTGFLVAPDLVLTAGHCMKWVSDCESTRIVFDYVIQDEGKYPTTTKSRSIYSCKKILFTQSTGIFNSSVSDFALFRLDRPVTDRRPIDTSRTVSEFVDLNQHPLIGFGYPKGMPLKASLGRVRRAEKEWHSILADIDMLHGNSGSPVFLAESFEPLGILVSGDRDFKNVYQDGKSCKASYVCRPGRCNGEKLTKIRPLLHLLR